MKHSKSIDEKYNILNIKTFIKISQFFFIGTKYSDFINFNYPKNSIIIDPFRYIYNIKNSKLLDFVIMQLHKLKFNFI